MPTPMTSAEMKAACLCAVKEIAEKYDTDAMERFRKTGEWEFRYKTDAAWEIADAIERL